MGWFKSYDSSDFPREITDGNGDTWKNAADHAPGRNGEPTYYNATGPDGYALTPSEIEAEHGRRS
jgi:hypothetical protein